MGNKVGIVSLEIAKKLKEASFDWKCQNFYKDGELRNHSEENSDIHYNKVNIFFEGVMSEIFSPDMSYYENCYDAPDLETVHRWLREEKNIYIGIKPEYRIQCDGTYELCFDACCYNYKAEQFSYENSSDYDYALELSIENALDFILETEK